MKFKVSFLNNVDVKETLCAVGWNSSDEVFCCGDDRFLLKWNLVSKDSMKTCDFPQNVYPVDLHCFVKNQGGGKKNFLEQILLTSTDGKCHIIGKSGRIEKSVEAHRGAVLVGKWSSDGTGFLTGGEDGVVKIWSRSGMLRSTIVQESMPIYSATWSPDSSQILYTNNKMLVLKSLATNVRTNRWKAHDGLILKIAWNGNNNLIISGGEDCKYKVWDIYGRQLYASVVHDHPITSLSWSPSGDYFAVGSFNTLRLCDKSGWSYCLEKPHCGSIYGTAWSNDGTQVAAACANGSLLLAHVIDRCYHWLNYEVILVSRKCLHVKDISADTAEQLDFPERVIHVSLSHNHLVVTTSAQCYIYNINNFNTPTIMDLKDGSVSLILLSERHFLLMERSSISVYGYDGRQLYSPKWPNMQCDNVNRNTISLSNDSLVVRDQLDDKVIHILDLGATIVPSTYSHKIGIAELCLNQCGSNVERYLAFIDKNRDLYLLSVMLKSGVSPSRKVEKLAVMVQSIAWNMDSNILAGIQDTALTVWYYPAVVFVDNRLLRRSISVKDTSEFGRSPTITGFYKNKVSVRRSDGSLMHSYVSPLVAVLQNYATVSKWQDCLKLCRTTKDEVLWACLAGLALYGRDLDTAEEAYAAIDLLDKVAFIKHIKTIKTKAIQLSEIALLGGNVEDAELLLLQKGLVFRAIFLNIRMHHWSRALELAMKHKTHVDTVLLYRRKYLQSFDKTERNKRFLELGEMDLDESTIEQKVSMEFKKEETIP